MAELHETPPFLPNLSEFFLPQPRRSNDGRHCTLAADLSFLPCFLRAIMVRGDRLAGCAENRPWLGGTAALSELRKGSLRVKGTRT